MLAVMPVYRRAGRFVLCLHLLVLLAVYKHDIFIYSLLSLVQDSENLATKVHLQSCLKKSQAGTKMRSNIDWSVNFALSFIFVILAYWLVLLLFLSGDIHPNPGPSTPPSPSSTISSNFSIVPNLSSLSQNLSIMHYNVQSIFSKLEVLHTELIDFDILTFSETWLNDSIDTDDLLFQSFNKPERKDRPGDSHGGVMLYVKKGIHYKRRNDLELRNIESIWIEVANSHKRVLVGVFYRPPNADAAYLSYIEDSFGLAIDTGIKDIIITGDFNLNATYPNTQRKIDCICSQFSLCQLIVEPTHFTEQSSSIIDFIFITNKDNVLLSGVGDPFLQQNIRYHCPVYVFLKFSKPKKSSFERHIWYYDKGNYNNLRNKVRQTDWNSLQDDDIEIYANNISNQVSKLAAECIPNKLIRIKPSEPSWITSNVKKYIRKRKRAYRKAKRTNTHQDWLKFKKLRNHTTQVIRDAKQKFYDNIAAKLASDSLSSKDWWSTLKSFIIPDKHSSIPPLEHNDKIYSSENDKANLLNSFFLSQSNLNDRNAHLPAILPTNVKAELNSIVLTSDEVESVLKILPVGKATGPNGVSNRILRELSHELSIPYCSLFNQSLDTGQVPSSYKEANVSPVPKKCDLSVVSNYRPIS